MSSRTRKATAAAALLLAVTVALSACAGVSRQGGGRHRLDLKVGDLFVFFSDGVTDAQDPLLREFGSDRLLKVIDQLHDRSAREIVDAIFAAVLEFRGDMPPNDDTTAVVVRITG